MSEKQVIERIESTIKQHYIVLYMKGTTDFPMCGFSARVVDILKSYNVDFISINVLEDENLRQSIKDYSKWPTIPQLYIRGVFVGGCDIVHSLHENGDLEAKLFPDSDST